MQQRCKNPIASPKRRITVGIRQNQGKLTKIHEEKRREKNALKIRELGLFLSLKEKYFALLCTK